MPADRRARAVFIEEGHGERVGIDAGPLGNAGAQRQQKGRQWPGRRPSYD